MKKNTLYIQVLTSGHIALVIVVGWLFVQQCRISKAGRILSDISESGPPPANHIRALPDNNLKEDYKHML